MNYYLLHYTLTENYLEDRGKYRAEHLAMASKSFEEKQLVLGGALDNPADSAYLVFRSEDQTVAENFAKNDPYVKNGLIKKWEVRKWNVVVGNK